MARATVHNIRDERWFNIDGPGPNDVYIGRPRFGSDGYFGNPYAMKYESERSAVIRDFERWSRARIESDPEYRERVKALHGKRLFCFCVPLPCHGDVLSRIAEELNG